MTAPTVRKPRTSLDELAQTCRRCGHQNGGHTGGASRSGWALFDPVWANATGWCMVPDCDCPGRTNDPAAAKVTGGEREVPPVITPPPPTVTRLNGPCNAGEGPCGNPETRPYACGPRCAEHAPGGAS